MVLYELTKRVDHDQQFLLVYALYWLSLLLIDGETILSQEVITQGDPFAMGMYAP